ncbi:hypothetical protein SBP02_15145 [Pseudomonas benzenivorans]|uniref:Phage abortive infection protein n=1 Tax=Pseudomonas benzenivorans TaxID=556533 RepID=A0ABZ0PU52_9PSED|nr:hypothetical protein [Pseudomonas benzenivorans]WPC04100.1 hypothetical protein SBP02_15145 [Pseudomonas benzenivorans]
MFSKISPSTSVPLFYAFATSGLIIRFFIANLYGMLFLALGLYYNSHSIFGTEAYTPAQLIDWFAAQSESTKTALLSSIVTVIGFLIAYATATYNWKAQALSELRMQAASEIDAFFSQCAKLTTDCQIYANALSHAVDKIQKNCTIEEAAFLAHYNRDQGQLFLQQRQQLIALGIEVHRLNSRHTNLLVLAPGLKGNMELATKALTNITEKIWFHVPFHIDGDQNPILTFIQQVNVADCMVFSKAAEDNFGQLNFSSGIVRGNLQSSVIGFSLWSLLFLLRERSGFKKTIAEHYNAVKKANTARQRGQ